MREKKSLRIFEIPLDEFKKLVANSKTVNDILRYFGLSLGSRARKIVTKRILEEKIDVSHFLFVLNSPKKRSRIWKMPSEEFKKLVANSKWNSDVLKHLGLSNDGRNYENLQKRILEEKIDISHFSQTSNPGQPLEEILVENSMVHQALLKRRLLHEKLIVNECALCGLKPFWNGLPIVLQLDHINGINNDNRIENLRTLCPNCHSQTPTYCSKNKARESSESHKCLRCDATTFRVNHICQRCTGSKETLLEISKEDLEKLIWEISLPKLGKLLGFNTRTIEKRCKQFGIIRPPRGFWGKSKENQLKTKNLLLNKEISQKKETKE